MQFISYSVSTVYFLELSITKPRMSSLHPKRSICSNLSLIILLTFLSSCGHEQVRRVPESTAGSEAPATVARRSPGQQAASVAVRQIGVPYRYGGNSVSGFDCSGLAQYSYARAGKQIPRTTAQQWRHLEPVKRSNLVVGDLLFFRIAGEISHVGMYLGENRFVHAPSSGREVSIASLDSGFYKRAFVRGGRP